MLEEERSACCRRGSMSARCIQDARECRPRKPSASQSRTAWCTRSAKAACGQRCSAGASWRSTHATSMLCAARQAMLSAAGRAGHACSGIDHTHSIAVLIEGRGWLRCTLFPTKHHTCGSGGMQTKYSRKAPANSALDAKASLSNMPLCGDPPLAEAFSSAALAASRRLRSCAAPCTAHACT